MPSTSPIKPFVKNLRDSLAPFHKNPRRAMQQPEKTLGRIKERAAAVWKRDEGANALTGLFLALPRDKDGSEFERVYRDGVARERTEFSKGPGGTSLLALMDAARTSRLISPALVLLPLQDVEAIESWRAWGKIERCLHVRDEALMLAATDAFVASEPIYARFVRSAWCLAHLAAGTMPKAPQWDFGRLIGETTKLLSAYPDVVDSEAGYIRNTAGHPDAQSRHFDHATKTVLLRKPRGSWRLQTTAPALRERLFRNMATANMRTSLFSIAWNEDMLESGAVAALPLLRRAFDGDSTADAELRAMDLDARIRAVLFPKQHAAEDLWFLPSQVA